MTTALISSVLGLWMIVSAFLWPHSPAQFSNACFAGGLVLFSALVARRGRPWAMYLVAAVGLWLLVSSLLLRASAATLWNNLVIGLSLFVLGRAPIMRTAA
jgi:hypothetical protein